MLGSKLFSAPFKVGDVLKWPELLSGDMFLSQLHQEPVVTRHIPAASEVDGMSSGCSSRSPASSSDVLQLYRRSLGTGVLDQERGRQKGLPVAVSFLPQLLLFYLGKDFPMAFFTRDIYITEIPESLHLGHAKLWTELWIIFHHRWLHIILNLYLD